MRHTHLVPLLAAAILLAVVSASDGPVVVSAAPGAVQGVTSSTSASAIGLSVHGRAIDISCLGDGNSTVLLVGGLHTGMEAISSELALELAALLRSGAIEVPTDVRVCLLPTLNPDGVALDIHTNARGVDLNRNWPAANWSASAYHPETGTVSGGPEPLSEPETSALYNYIVPTQPALVVVFHCCGSIVEANSVPGASALGLQYAAAAGFDYIDTWQLYTVTGQFIDAMDSIGIPAIDIELERPDDAGLAQHRAALVAVLATITTPQPPPLAAPNPPSVAATPNPPAATTYIVQPGDTLANIAWQFAVNVDRLAATNHVLNPALIEVGDRLTIP